MGLFNLIALILKKTVEALSVSPKRRADSFAAQKATAFELAFN
jgi:hypothetical protein